MAIDTNLETITSGYNRSKIASNFSAIQEALQDGLSRSGTGPNQMEADLDMNSNDILNVNEIQTETLVIDGIPVTGDTIGVDPDALLPLGGTDGQVLTKQSSADYDADWENPAPTYTDENAQDAVGSILLDSGEIDFTYNDATPSITAALIAGSIDETKLDTSVNASLDLADTSVQPTDLPYVTPEDYGAIGNGVADDTTAVQNAINSGKSVWLKSGSLYKTTSGLTISTSYQRVFGAGRLVPVGSFDAVTVGSSANGVDLDLTFNSASQTGGNAVNINTAHRTRIRKLYIPDGGYNALNVQGANHTVVDWVYAPALRGTHGIRWYGETSIRSDILILRSGTISFATSGTARGIDWDGNCHSLTIFNFGIVGASGVGANRPLHGLHIRNTSGGTAPAIARIFGLEIDFPHDDGVKVDVGLDYDFVGSYLQGSVNGSGINVAAITADNVRLTGGKSTGNNQYGIETLSEVLVSNFDLSSNSAGAVSGTVAHRAIPEGGVSDNYLPRFDSTTGKLQTSKAFVTDAGTYRADDDQNAYAIIAARFSSGFGGSAINTSSASTFLDFQVNGTAILRQLLAGQVTRLFGSLSRNAPVTKTADFTVADTENWLINNKSGSACTVTLPSAASFIGRELMIKNIQAQAVNSASSNVVPLAGGAAGTVILTNTAGRWCTMVSDGTNWIQMAGVI